MPQVDFHERQLTLKLVYCGPPQSGKTSNLRALHAAVDARGRGRLMTLDTVDDRTVFFDLLPIFVRISGFAIRIKVYTVPGQPLHDATRRVVLQGADGIVFVADSAASQAGANRQAWASLERHRAALALDQLPVVVQYNKRDLLAAVDIETADRFGLDAVPQEAIARTGVGVVETFHAIAAAAWAATDHALSLTSQFGLAPDVFQAALAAHVTVAGRDIVPP